MSKIPSVLWTCDQGLRTEEKARARANIDAVSASEVPAQVNADWDAESGPAQILNRPTLATVATTGSYTDLLDTPNMTYTAGDGINITNNVVSRRVQYVYTNNSYTYVCSIIERGDLPVLDVANGSMHNYFVCTMKRGSDIQFFGAAYGQPTMYNLSSSNVWTSIILEPQILPSSANKALFVDASGTGTIWKAVRELPSFSTTDNDKVLKVQYDGSSVKTVWSNRSSGIMLLTSATVGLNSSSQIVLTQEMIDNHFAYIYLDKTKFPSTLDGSTRWWEVGLHSIRFYKSTADASLAGTTWDNELTVTTSNLDTPFNDANTSVIRTMHFKWISTGLFTDYDGGQYFLVDYLNSDTAAMFIKLDLYGYTSKLAVGDYIDFQGTVRACTNLV